jgi:hypothetical protein
MIEAIPVGSVVSIVHGPKSELIEGVVKAVCVRDGNQVTYEVVWWNGRARQVEWLMAGEVVWTPTDKPLRIGFDVK